MVSFYHILALLPAVVLAVPGTGCTSVGIITARASTEASGEGIIGSLAQLIQQRSSQTVSRASVDYPALLFPYASSSAAGVAALKKQLTAAVQKCPDQKIVLLGYSQGAHVLGDVLGGGGGGALGAKTPAIGSEYSSRGTTLDVADVDRAFADGI
jgi:acetylxylan esterase